MFIEKNREETGDIESKPLAIGGGTYAKDADNVIAFGLIFPGH
jgi:succinyl-diaminopimelate desuccinylase